MNGLLCYWLGLVTGFAVWFVTESVILVRSRRSRRISRDEVLMAQREIHLAGGNRVTARLTGHPEEPRIGTALPTPDGTVIDPWRRR